MPDDLIKDAEGDMILEQVDIRVCITFIPWFGYILNELEFTSPFVVYHKYCHQVWKIAFQKRTITSDSPELTHYQN